MIPNELLDGNARIHSNADTVHARRCCPYPQESPLMSYTCYMMPCLLLDGNARMDSNPDRVHARRCCPYPQEGSLTSYTCYMMPCLLCDANARIDSSPDTVHLWETEVESFMPGPDKLDQQFCVWCRSKNPRVLKIQDDTR